ncbi:MAG: serine/threonine-protein kinase, partial [Planctomycetota bacterium]
MSDRETTEVERLFQEAAERPPAERPGYLDEACRDRPDVRREVESLLDAHERAEDRFREPRFGLPLLPAEAEPATRLVGERIGSFRLTRYLAEGGVGAVYEAEQESPRRRVALKLLKGAAGPSSVRRFLEESEILARLEHPGIAHVYEAGVHRLGLETFPYFAMEFVEEARPVTAHCREKGLGLRERLDLFLRICEAVQHGHGRGIIHRDLKPSNLLVDAAGNPKVIDFGVARATSADLAVTALRTEPGRIVGTLQYMSP